MTDFLVGVLWGFAGIIALGVALALISIVYERALRWWMRRR